MDAPLSGSSMGFPVPGDATEPSLDLNRHLITDPAATFILPVGGDGDHAQVVTRNNYGQSAR